MARNSRVSLDRDGQVRCTIIPQCEKPEALITLEQFVRKEPDVHFARLFLIYFEKSSKILLTERRS
jgi:hypothetical protein